MLCCQPKTQRASLLAIHEASRAFIDKRLILTGIIAALIYSIGPAMFLSTCRLESGREYDWVTVTIRRVTASEIEVQRIHLMIDNGVNTSRANPNSDEDGNHWVMNCPADLGREAFVVVDLRDEEGRECSEICGFPRGLPWSPKDDRDSWKSYRCQYSAARLNAAQIASLDTRLEEYAKLAIASNVEVRFSWSGTVRN